MILLTKKARQMIELAVQKEPTLEVGGFGRVELRSGMIVVTQIFIPPQEVGTAHTDIEGADLRVALEALLRAGSTLSQWSFWWHSHCSMGVTPSGQDDSTLRLLVQEVPQLGWFAGMVTNVKGDYHGWLEVTRPLPINTKVDVYLDEEPIPKKTVEEVDRMMEHVKRKVYTPPKTKAAALWQGNGNQHKKNCICWSCQQQDPTKMDDAEEEAMMHDLKAYMGVGDEG